jgi:hypothetical protein
MYHKRNMHLLIYMLMKATMAIQSKKKLKMSVKR